MTRIDPRVARNNAAALTAARELLLERGWEAVTHVAVAARSGVGRTTLYRHWPDAAAMLRDLVAHALDTKTPAPTGHLRDDLIAMVEVFRSQLHDPVMERIMRLNIERAGVDPAFGRIKDALFERGGTAYQEVFDAARAAGDLTVDVDVARATERLLGPLLFRRLMADQDFDHTYVVEVVDDFLALLDRGR